MRDLLDEVDLPAAPQRRWTDHHAERRGVLRVAPNGHVAAFTHVCAGCGREFQSNRRPNPLRRSWCGREECKRTAAAERAKQHRDRQAQEHQNG